MRFFKQLLNLLLELWPLAIAGLLFVVSKSQEWAFLFPEKGQVIDYWFMVRSRTLIYGLAICILPLAIITIAAWFFKRPAKTKGPYFNPLLSLLIDLVGIGLLIYATGLMCIQTFALSNKDFGHFQSAQLDRHVYYVDSIWREGVWQQYLAYFMLFECDEAGKLCQGIYEKVYTPNEEEYKRMTTVLITNPAENTITMEINGAVVYVHQVK